MHRTPIRTGCLSLASEGRGLTCPQPHFRCPRPATASCPTIANPGSTLCIPIAGLDDCLQRTATAISRRWPERRSSLRKVASAFYDRFTRSLAVFMRRVVEELMETLEQTEAKFSGLLRSFRD